MRRRDVLKLAATAAAGAPALFSKSALADECGPTVIERDICILGGGAAGTYAAVKLRDLGRSVAVVERSERLGGHCHTYTDRASGIPIDYGVVVFPDEPHVHSYFGRFGVPLIRLPSDITGAEISVDFRTGRQFSAFQPPPALLGGAMFEYLSILQSQFPFLAQPGYQLPLSGPTLDLLASPFQTFLERFSPQPIDLLNFMPLFSLYLQGSGFVPQATTLYILKNQDIQVTNNILNQSFYLAPGGAEQLYRAAAASLGADVLYRADLEGVERHGRDRVMVRVRTPAGMRLIRARKLLVTIPPMRSAMRPFDLDPLEERLFGRFTQRSYHTAIARIEGIPPGVRVINRSPETQANVVTMPGLYGLIATGAPGLYNLKFGGDRVALDDRQVRAQMVADIERIEDIGAGRVRFRGFEVFRSHTPYSLEVSPADIRAGFYRSLQSLQGRNKTYYAGAAFQAHNSARIWTHIDALLPQLAT